MKAGVILEIQDGQAVILDGSGQFRQAPARAGWQPGDVVRLPAIHKRRQWAAGLAACVVLALLGSGGWLWLRPASLLSLDVNPSVELAVNRFDRVVQARAMNDEGEALLGAENVKGMPSEEALAALLESDFLQPYLAREGAVTLTVQSGDTDAETRLLALADDTLGDAVRVSCHSVDGELVEEAHEHGVTAGKYLALLNLQAADPAIDIGEYTHCGIDEIEEQAEKCHEASQSADPDTTSTQGTGCGGDHSHDHHGHE